MKTDFPKTPDRLVFLPDDAVLIHRQKYRFFQNVWDFLGYNELRHRKAFVCTYSQQLTSAISNEPIQSNDRISSLIICDLCVATVYERRNDLNMVEVSFALYLDNFSQTELERVHCRGDIK